EKNLIRKCQATFQVVTRAKGDGTNGIPVEVYDIQNLSRWVKILRSPSTALRTNGEELMSLVFSFMLRCSKHSGPFFSNLPEWQPLGGNYGTDHNSRSSSLARVVSSGRFAVACLSATGHGFGGSHRLLRRPHSHFPAGRGGAPARLHA